MILLLCFLSIYNIGYKLFTCPRNTRDYPDSSSSSSWTSRTTFLIFFASTSAKSVFFSPRSVFHFLFCTVSKEGVPCSPLSCHEFGQDVSRLSWLSIYRFSQLDRNWFVLSLQCTVWTRTITLFVVPTRPTTYKLAELIPWNRFLGSLTVYKFGLRPTGVGWVWQ